MRRGLEEGDASLAACTDLGAARLVGVDDLQPEPKVYAENGVDAQELARLGCVGGSAESCALLAEIADRRERYGDLFDMRSAP